MDRPPPHTDTAAFHENSTRKFASSRQKSKREQISPSGSAITPNSSTVSAFIPRFFPVKYSATSASSAPSAAHTPYQ